MNNFTTAAVASLIASIGIIIIALIIFSSPAPGSPYCMTKEEARAKWPKEHLYWHTENRCWDATRGWTASRRALAQVKGPTSPAPVVRRYMYPLDANGNIDRKFEDHCCWPDIISLKAWMIEKAGQK